MHFHKADSDLWDLNAVKRYLRAFIDQRYLMVSIVYGHITRRKVTLMYHVTEYRESQSLHYRLLYSEEVPEDLQSILSCSGVDSHSRGFVVRSYQM